MSVKLGSIYEPVTYSFAKDLGRDLLVVVSVKGGVVRVYLTIDKELYDVSVAEITNERLYRLVVDTDDEDL